MGLTNWIKEKYYNHRLSVANKQRAKGKYAKSEKTYDSIVGKHPDAYLQLAEMLVDNAQGKENLLLILDKLEKLRKYGKDSEAFVKVFENHLSNIEIAASKCFEKAQYKDAVNLQNSIQLYRNNKVYEDSLNRYLAYEAFEIDNGLLLSKETLYENTAKYLNLISDFPKSDVQSLVQKLQKEKKYLRIVLFLSHIKNRQQWLKDEINKSILEAVLDNDSEIKRLKSFKDISSDQEIKREGAVFLYNKAKEYAKKKNFKIAVLLTNFASEILSDNKDFNLDRCKFILEEFRPRINSKEIKDLMSLSKKLKLDEQQISQLKKRINEIAVELSPKESIEISRIFIGESIFDKLYLERALTLAKKGESLDLTELHRIINNLTDELTLPNVLGSFTPYIPSFKDEFIESAIKAIKKEVSVELLDIYWEILPDINFVTSLIANDNASWEKFAHHIKNNHEKYFTQKEVSLEIIKQFIRQSNNANDTIIKRNWDFEILETDIISRNYNYYKFSFGQHGRVNDVLRILVRYAQEHYLSALPEHQGSAELILEKLESYPEFWLQLKSWLRNQEAIKEEYPEVLSRDANALKEIVAKYNNCKTSSNEEFVKLWKRYIENRFDEIKESSHKQAIKLLTNLLKASSSYASEIIYNEYKDAIIKSLVKQKWELAVEKEKNQEYEEAISLYDQIVAHDLQSFNNRAEIRSLICHVKFNDIDESIAQRIQEAIKIKSFQALREDLIYRYVCRLIEQVRPDEAETLIKEYLPDEYELLAICEKLGVKQAELKLEEFNNYLKKINTKLMSVEDATSFLSNINNYKKSIIGRLPDLSRSFAKYKKQIESYILWKMFEEEDYLNIIQKLITDNPNYIEEDTVFRNIAIASLGLIESEETNEILLKRAISTVLTAIFTDRLFVRSLDYTSWDDKYNFTLDNSFGGSKEWEYQNLPENVNFDYAQENSNVAIKDVQNNLLTRLETSVRKYHPELEEFVEVEKNALQNLIELNLDESFILASPNLARTLPSIRISIETALDAEIAQNYDNKEEAIALGCEYGFSSREYDLYSQAKTMLWNCKSSLSKQPVTTVSNAFEQFKIDHIKRYSRLFSELSSLISNSINEDIREELDYKNFLLKYELPVKIMNEVSLALTCSNYLNCKIIRLLNEDSMKLRDGVGYMVRIYQMAPSDITVKKNLESMLCGLAADVESNNSSLDRNALNKAMFDTNNQFKKQVEDAILNQKLSEIIDKFNAGSMKKNTALTQVYDLYKTYPNNERVCENLATICELCIFEYIIPDKYGSSGVKSTLNAIAKNMSPTFKQKAKKLGKTFNDMWSKIPQSTKDLMCGGLRSIGMNQYLNENGKALKLGLQYLKKFGSVQRSYDSLENNAFGIRISKTTLDLIDPELPDLPL